MTGSTRRARQEDAARHSEAQRSSTLKQVRTRFDDYASSLQSSWGVSNDDDRGPTEDSHVPALVLEVHLSVPDIVSLI